MERIHANVESRDAVRNGYKSFFHTLVCQIKLFHSRIKVLDERRRLSARDYSRCVHDFLDSPRGVT
jgi:hypothetical protein